MSTDRGTTFVRFDAIKWCAEGSTTLQEVATQLEDLAEMFRRMHASGKVELDQVVDGGFVHTRTSDPATADLFGMTPPEDDECPGDGWEDTDVDGAEEIGGEGGCHV